MNYTAALKYILCIKMTFIKFYNYILQKIIFFDKSFYPTNFFKCMYKYHTKCSLSLLCVEI